MNNFFVLFIKTRNFISAIYLLFFFHTMKLMSYRFRQDFNITVFISTSRCSLLFQITSVKPGVRTEAAFAKEFPVSSGSQHRKKEADGAYGEWVPVEKKIEKPPASVPASVSASVSASSETKEASKENDSVFPEAPSQVSVQLLKCIKLISYKPHLQLVSISSCLSFLARGHHASRQ